MAFENIPVIEDYQFYLDVAFSRGKKTTDRVRDSIKGIDKLEKSRRIEMARIDSVKSNLVERFNKIVEEFPSIDHLTPFYNELVKITMDYAELKMSLGSVNWAAKTINTLGNECSRKVQRSQSIMDINNHRRHFYGRASSIVKDIKKNLKLLSDARKILIGFPVVKQMPTIAIAGFPNVGKSTLLSKITGSTPDIQAYAFTTKGLNLGYATINKKKIQFIDTPGTLARQDKMNDIERQAYLVLREAADLIIYVWDVTEPYPMEDQRKLFKNVKRFNKPIIQYLSKTDIADKDKIKEFQKKRNVVTDKTSLKKMIKTSFSDQ